MADERIVTPVKVVDPTTTSQQLGIDASGRATVNINGTVTVDTELPAAAALADDTANPTVPGVGAFAMVYDGSTWDRLRGSATGGVFVQGDIAHDSPVDAFPLLTGGRASAAAPTDVSADGDAVRGWYLRNGAQATVVTAAGALIGGDATNGLDVDVTRVTGTVTVDSELPAAAALADATANPTVPSVGSLLLGYNGTTWDRVRTANTGRLQVDVVTGGGTDAPTNPTRQLVTSAGVAAGASANLDSNDLPSKYLWQATFTASVPFKVVLSLNDNGSLTSLDTIFGRAGETVTWKPPHRAFAQAPAAGAGTQGWRAAMTNMDTSEAADVYATFMYADN